MVRFDRTCSAEICIFIQDFKTNIEQARATISVTNSLRHSDNKPSGQKDQVGQKSVTIRQPDAVFHRQSQEGKKH